jgi:hypothetical protein
MKLRNLLSLLLLACAIAGAQTKWYATKPPCTATKTADCTPHTDASGNLLVGGPLPPLTPLPLGAPNGILVSNTFYSPNLERNVKAYGAIGDGGLHPLSDTFSTLAAAQAVYPHATSLTQTTDWAGIQAAINTGKPVYCARGFYELTTGLVIATNNQPFRGTMCSLEVQPGFTGPVISATKGSSRIEQATISGVNIIMNQGASSAVGIAVTYGWLTTIDSVQIQTTQGEATNNGQTAISIDGGSGFSAYTHIKQAYIDGDFLKGIVCTNTCNGNLIEGGMILGFSLDKSGVGVTLGTSSDTNSILRTDIASWGIGLSVAGPSNGPFFPRYEGNTLDWIVQPGATNNWMGSGFATYQNYGTGTTWETPTVAKLSNSNQIADYTTLGAESLYAPTAGFWLYTGDCAFSTPNQTCTYSTGAGTITLQTTHFAPTAPVALSERMYAFTYTVSAATQVGATLTLTTTFAKTATVLSLTAGAHTYYVESASPVSNFVLSLSGMTSGAFTLGSMSLKEITGGRLMVGNEIVANNFTGKWSKSVPVLTAALPTCNAAAAGTNAAVSDATTPAIGSALTGGGAVFAAVVCNGATWKVNGI